MDRELCVLLAELGDPIGNYTDFTDRIFRKEIFKVLVKGNRWIKLSSILIYLNIRIISFGFLEIFTCSTSDLKINYYFLFNTSFVNLNNQRKHSRMIH